MGIFEFKQTLILIHTLNVVFILTEENFYSIENLVYGCQLFRKFLFIDLLNHITLNALYNDNIA